MATSSRGVPPLVVVILTMLAFGGGIAFTRFVGAAADAPHDESGILVKSIAVLPFADLGGANSPDTAAVALTKDVASALASLRDVRVVSGVAVDSAWKNGRSLSSLAGTLAVTHVLEGSVRFVDSRVRVTVQLVEATHSQAVFQETWDWEANNLPQLIADLRTRLAEAIRQAPGRLSDA